MGEKENYIFIPSGGNKDNPIASLLETMSIIIFIGGFICGIAFGKNTATVSYILSGRESSFQWSHAIAVWLSALLAGSLLLGFREIICLLQLQQSQQYSVKAPPQ